MKYYKKIVGDRIYLSPMGVSSEEVEKITEWMNDFNVTDYIGKSGASITESLESEFLEKSTKNMNIRSFYIVDLENDNLIGVISLEKFNNICRSAVLGIFIGDEEYRNKGYGKEAINLLLEYGFRYLNLHSIKLSLLGINERAHKCYLKCGFKDIGCGREEIYINGKYYDKKYMDILENEFNGDYIRNKNI